MPEPAPFPGPLPDAPPEPTLTSEQVEKAKDIALTTRVVDSMVRSDPSYSISGVAPWTRDGELLGALVVMEFGKPGGLEIESDWPFLADKQSMNPEAESFHGRVIGLRTVGLLIDLHSDSLKEVQLVSYDRIENGPPAPPDPPDGWVGE